MAKIAYCSTQGVLSIFYYEVVLDTLLSVPENAWGFPQIWLSRASVLGWFCTFSVVSNTCWSIVLLRSNQIPGILPHTHTQPLRQSINCRHLTSLCCLTGSIVRDASLVNCCRAGVPIWLWLAQDVDGSMESLLVEKAAGIWSKVRACSSPPKYLPAQIQ